MPRSRFMRALGAFSHWLDMKLPEPRLVDAQSLADAWDYDQADQQPWTAEPDAERLSALLTFLRSDRPGAIPELRALAAMGSPSALNLVGQFYYWGDGLPQDRAEGVAWFEEGVRRWLRARLA